MSFQAHLIFQICLVVVFSGFSRNVRAAYENNPFFQGENRPGSVQTLPTDKPQVTQSPVIILSTSQQISTTKEPESIYTIEPPSVLYGDNLNKKCLKPRGQFPSHTCKKYVNCWDGVAIEQFCLGNFLFNPVTLYCDFPGNVDCQGKPITKGTSPPPSISSEHIPTSSSILNPSKVVAPNSLSSGVNPSLRRFCRRSTGLFPGSTCSKFVNCWDDNAVEQDCPPGLYFSSEGHCDYPENVHCDNNGKDGLPTRVKVNYGDCPLEFGNFRNRSDCGQYYTCAFHRIAARYNCPNGLSFSDILGICDYSYRVDCSKEPQFFDIREIKNQDSDCPLEFGNFRNRTNCSQYYTCAFHKVAARYECTDGFSFSDLLGVCDYSYRVDCTKEPQIYQKTTTDKLQGHEFPFNAFAHPDLNLPSAAEDSRCTVTNGLVRARENCSTYYVCEFGRVVSNYECPSGFKFSNEFGICDYEEKVNCNSSSKAFEIGNNNVIVVPNITNEVLSQVQKCVPGSVFRLNPQCTSACRCRNGVAEIIECTAGLAYDSETDKCVLAHLARC